MIFNSCIFFILIFVWFNINEGVMVILVGLECFDNVREEKCFYLLWIYCFEILNC